MPLWNSTPSRRRNVHTLASSVSHDTARSGISAMFRSKRTRVLATRCDRNQS